MHEMFGKFRIIKYLSEVFRIYNGYKIRSCFIPAAF